MGDRDHDMTTRDELVGCPFCGGEALMLKDHKRLGVYIVCTVCHVCGLTGLPLEAIRHWNTRASRQEVSVTVEELARGLDPLAFVIENTKRTGVRLRHEMALASARALLAKYSITNRTTEG